MERLRDVAFWISVGVAYGAAVVLFTRLFDAAGTGIILIAG